MSDNKTVENSHKNFGSIFDKLFKRADKIGNMLPGYDDWEKEELKKKKEKQQ